MKPCFLSPPAKLISRLILTLTSITFFSILFCRLHQAGINIGEGARSFNARPCFHGLSHTLGHVHWMVEPLVFDFMESGVVVRIEEVIDTLRAIGVC